MKPRTRPHPVSSHSTRAVARRAFCRLLLLAGCLAILPTAGLSAQDKLLPVDVRRVKVGGEIGRRIDVTVRNNLLVLDYENDFLKPFREKNAAGGYVGLGKTIDALVRMAAYTGDRRLLALKKKIVDKAIEAQLPDGYLGVMKPGRRVWTLWDIHEMGYLVYGLAMDHRFFGEEQSLEAARKLGDYIVTKWSAEPQKEPGGGAITVNMAVTGLESAMLALYGQTKDRRYLDFVVKFRRLPEWDGQIVLGRWGQIAGHAYAHMCRLIAQLRLERIQPDPRLLAPTGRLMDFLRAGDGMVITGEVGDHECWHDTQTGTINLGETCATAYLIRLMDERLRMTGETLSGDIMERAIFNALFAAQSPDGRKIRYYTPFDGPRTYFKGDTYCCPCNYRRIVAELPRMIYYRQGGGLAVNLYTPSEAAIELARGLSVKIRQETGYPHDGKVLIRVDPSKPAAFPLALRIPRWANGAAATIAGRPIGGQAKPGAWLVIDRPWNPGDEVTLTLPMTARLVRGRKAQSGCVAVMRGPLVFCLNRARNKLPSDLDLRLITIDPDTLEGPVADEAVPGCKLAFHVKAWGAGRWYPMAAHDLSLVLTEFPDPGGEAVYFHVPNPKAKQFVEDELVGSGDGIPSPPPPPARKP
jgi:DUF1680 family protein